MLLRPTESRILWLQQFGRGLRFRPGKTLNVIDYIGNHRVFLTKTRALLSLGEGDRAVAYALDQLETGAFELPPGCTVTYELEAKEILRALIRPPAREDALRDYYEDFRTAHGARPLAIEAFQDGYDPKAARSGYGSWLDFVRAMGDFTEAQETVWERHGAFLRELEVTPMTRSYKMLVLLGMLAEDAFPGRIPIERLAHRFAELALRYTAVRTEVGDALEDPAKLRRLIETNPIEAWTGGGGTGGVAYFSYDDGAFATTIAVPPEQREALQDLVAEIAEWRLGVYLRRVGASRGAGRIVCKVSHAGGRPILFLPDRTRHEGIPEGWHDILADGESYQANFVKIAINTATAPGSSENVLPELLRRWFGPEAGRPGRTDEVVFERSGGVYVMMPADRAAERSGPALWQRYPRAEVPALFGIKLTGWEKQEGVVSRPEGILLFVTLEKGKMAEEHRYEDRFLSPTDFQWQSQNKTAQRSERAQILAHHRERGVDVHLFVRRRPKVGGQTQPFVYCGTLDFQRWEGEKPITVWWRLREAVPAGLWGELSLE